MKRIYLVRHAQAEWIDGHSVDFDRPLSKKGRDDALTLAEYMRMKAIAPELILCSPALRTRQTAHFIREQVVAPEPLCEDGLYLADWTALLERIRKADNRAASLLLIGHNPGLERLARKLPQSGGCAKGCFEYPTAGLAAFSAPIDDWADLKTESCALDFFACPEEMASEGG